MDTYFRYYDERFGDVYEIYTDHEGEFHSAKRSVDAIGRDPIYYYSIGEIPQPHQNVIEGMILARQRKKQ